MSGKKRTSMHRANDWPEPTETLKASPADHKGQGEEGGAEKPRAPRPEKKRPRPKEGEQAESGEPEPKAVTPAEPELEKAQAGEAFGLRKGEGEAGPKAGEEAAPAEAEAEKEPSAEELKDRLLRALAETENVRRRAEREREEVAKYAITSFARDLLSVADNLSRALESIPENAREGDELLKTLAEGVELTERELLNLFERYEIRKIEPWGEKFDYNRHQAMFEVPDSGKPEGTVVQVVRAGYTIGERLLRPAMVGVAKGGGAFGGEPEGPAEGDESGEG